MKVLSVRQPAAWLLVNGPKEIEDCSRVTRLCSAAAIHASAKAMTCENCEFLRELCEDSGLPVPLPEALPTGGIVNAVEILDCITESESPWFSGPMATSSASTRPAPSSPARASSASESIPARSVTWNFWSRRCCWS